MARGDTHSAAVKTVVDGITFPSKAEARRYVKLKLLERAGQIADLELHPKYELAPAVVLDGKRHRARVYIADFRYRAVANGEIVVEDVKGRRLDVYTLKRHLMKHIHGIEVKEIR